MTGIGVISPNGIGVDAFWSGLLKSKSGISRISTFDASAYRTKIAGEVKDFDPLRYLNSKKWERIDRFTQFGIAAGKMALEDARLDSAGNKTKNNIAVIIGSGLGGVFFYEKQLEVIQKGLPKLIHPSSLPRIMPSAVSGGMAIELGLKGGNFTLGAACASSAHSIGVAFDAIRLGRNHIVLSGGSEALIMPLIFAAFDQLRVMSTCNDRPDEASKPFDMNRDGFVLSEGAAVLVLEEFHHAVERGIRIYAEIVGYGSSSGAYHMVIPEPSGEDAVAAMSDALRDANMKPCEVDYICAHGTATKPNDKIETNAIQKVFKERTASIPVNAIKSTIGHLLGAAGSMSAVSALLVLKENVIPPTMNYKHPDPECALDIVANKPRKVNVNCAMVNAFGFGGTNAVILMKRLHNGKN